MSAWGKNGSARSCEALLRRVEENDPKLTELVILPLKKFGSQEVFRLAVCLDSGKSKNLRSLQASGHQIKDCDALEALGKALAHVESMAIGDSEMGDDGVCALCRGMEANRKIKNGSSALKSIDLSWKNIGGSGLISIFGVFAKLPSLEYMDLSRNESIGLSFDSWESKLSPSPSMPPFPSLTYIDFSSCCLDTKSCIALLKAMQLNCCDLDVGKREQEETVKGVRNLILKLNSNDLSDQNGIKEIMGIFSRGNLVTELYISKCQIGDEGMKQIVDECCSSSNLKAKNIVENQHNSVFLRRLDLSFNNLASITHLANRLRLPSDDISRDDCHFFSYLQTLDLSGNPLGHNLLASIECNPQWILSIEELDLSSTSCEISGAVELIRRSNSCNSSLKKLNLFGNGIGSDGFFELSKVLHGGHLSLEYLDLGGNGASESAVVDLVDVLKNDLGNFDENGGQHTPRKNKDNKLRVLVVGGNSGGAALEDAVKEVKKVHPNLDIAHDKLQQKGDTMPGGMFNNTPGTQWRP